MSASAGGAADVLLVAGRVRPADRVGHHDYRAGCALLARLLGQTPGVRAVAVDDGWPADPRALDEARAVVLYASGGREHPFAQGGERSERVQKAIDRGAGLVAIHQAVSVPPELAERAASWLGGAHVRGLCGAGHWSTRHREFPEHPVTRGVRPFELRDGWMNRIRFVEGMRGVTPLVWSGPTHRGSREGGPADVVCWAYARPGGGRSLAYTGLDAHSAWSLPGVRQLLVNGILWSAGLEVPAAGAPCAVDDATLRGLLTPRSSRLLLVARVARRALRRAARRVRRADPRAR